ncbi:MAG: hypothetical protein IIZ19_06360 [Clostridia bacterium]|nr:hypothetical protein [Clostridia bacterium]
MKTVLVIIIAAALAAAVILIHGAVDKPPALSPDDIGDFKVEYRSFGGMDGGEAEITLEALSDNEARLTFRIRPYYGAEEINESLTVPYEALYRVKTLYAERGVHFWGELPESDLIALDAPTIVVTFRADGKETVLSSDREFPDEGAGVLHETESILYEYIEKAKE